MKGPAPQCGICRHLAESGRRCVAFPEFIPEPIWTNVADHRGPFAGDGGVRFEPNPAVDPELVRETLSALDALRERLAAAGVAALGRSLLLQLPHPQLVELDHRRLGPELDAEAERW